VPHPALQPVIFLPLFICALVADLMKDKVHDNLRENGVLQYDKKQHNGLLYGFELIMKAFYNI
jgi:hypothetical protein